MNEHNASPELLQIVLNPGEAKSKLSISCLLLKGFCAGSALGVAGTVSVQSGLTFWGAALFSWGFVSIIIFGMELVTGNFAIFSVGLLAGSINWSRATKNWSFVYLDNFWAVCLLV